MEIIDRQLDFVATPNRLGSVEYLVIHHTASKNDTVNSIHNWHIRGNGWFGIGYHFVIDESGRVFKGREEYWQGTHAGMPANQESLGIALIGDFRGSSGPTDVQMDSLVELIEYLYDKYGEKPLYGHSNFMNTACPGDNFPFDKLEERIGGSGVKAEKLDNVYMFGKKVKAYKVDGETVVRLRELEKFYPKVTWTRERTDVEIERSEK